LRTVLTNEALERTLSRERLEKYLRVTHQDLDAALKLYEENTRLSEAFYTPLQCVEICLRNSIHLQLTNVYGEEWFREANIGLSNDSKSMIFDAIEGLRKDGRPIIPGRVIAELKFAFWVGLVGKGYDSTLWRRATYRSFLAQGSKARSTVHSRLNAIRRFRNRIAHHEPIFHRPLVQMHAEVIEAIGWMCRETSAWAVHHSRFDQVSTTVEQPGAAQ
jgi:hypothetical protein